MSEPEDPESNIGKPMIPGPGDGQEELDDLSNILPLMNKVLELEKTISLLVAGVMRLDAKIESLIRIHSGKAN
jgi:hypothetical protein